MIILPIFFRLLHQNFDIRADPKLAPSQWEAALFCNDVSHWLGASQELEQLECLHSDGFPPPPNDYPYHWVILDPKSKEDKVKVTNLKNLPKFHATHLLKLLDKMCKYDMDPMSIVEDTKRTRFCPQTDRRTRWFQYTPLSTSLKGGGIISPGHSNWLLHSQWGNT